MIQDTIQHAFTNITTQTSYAEAMSNYLKDKASNIEKLLAIYSRALELQYEAFSSDDWVPNYLGVGENYVNHAFTDLGYSDQYGNDNYLNLEQFIPMSIGYVRAIDLGGAFLNQDRSGVGNDIVSIRVYQNDGITFYTQEVIASSLIEELKGSLHSAVTMSAAIEAMQFNNITDRLSYYRDMISEKFSNAYDDISGVGNFFTNSLRTSENLSQFLSSMSQLMNLQDFSDDDVNVGAINTSDFYLYTGVSPLSTLCATGVLSVAGQTLNIMGTIVIKVFNGVSQIIGSIINKATRYLNQTVINPKDIELANDKANSPSLEGMHYHANFDRTFRLNSSNFPGYIASYDGLVKLLLLLDPSQIGGSGPAFISHSVKQFELKTGVMNIKIDNTSITGWAEDYSYVDVNVKGGLDYRPYPISYTSWELIVSNLTKSLDADDNYIIPRTELNLEAISSTLGILSDADLYVSNDASERDFLAGYLRGFSLSVLICELMYYSGLASSSMDSRLISETWINERLDALGTINNSHFISVGSGYNFVDETVYYEPYTGLSMLSPEGYFGDVSWMSVMVFFLLSKDYTLAFNPLLNYFVPFNSNKNLPSAMYRVKTDSQNIQAFNKLLTVSVIAITILAVTISSSIVINKVSRSLSAKAFNVRSRIMNSVSNTGKISSKDALRLKFCNFILGKQSLITTGLQQGSVAASSTLAIGNLFSSTANQDKNFQNIAEIITG